MKVSKLINKLQELKVQHGDVNVIVNGINMDDDMLIYYEHYNELEISDLL